METRGLALNFLLLIWLRESTRRGQFKILLVNKDVYKDAFHSHASLR